MNTLLRVASVTTALVTAFALSTPSFAAAPVQGEPGAASQIVHFTDLDLSTAAGVHTLYGRIRSAAWQVCLKIVEPASASSEIENTKCRQTLIDAAVE
ncbi:MAG: UrcA family protein, partial [Steroidobacteraceae bacterium]